MTTTRRTGRFARASALARRGVGTGLAVAFLLILSPQARAQGFQPTDELAVAIGNSLVVTHPSTLERVSIANPDVADAVVVSAREIVLNGKETGTTTLLIWDQAGNRSMYTVRVSVDAPSLEREFRRQFPDEELTATAMGNLVILGGRVRDPLVARKAVTLAAALGEAVQVMDNIAVPDRGQILLQVRFAEVSRSALKELGATFMRVDPGNVRGDDEAFAGPRRPGGTFLGGSGPEQTFSDAVNFFLFHDASNVSAFIRALDQRGLFRSLAEPNLLALPGEEASFLAGGEFPFPVVQPSAAGQSVTIQFREFGIRLRFVPDIGNEGAIRLQVAPEVSSLDFANGLQIAGFLVPALTTRRAETVIELEDGQTFAIAGLMDNTMSETMSKIPLLGDIPVIGRLFRSRDVRESTTELLVLVTPRIVRPLDEAPELPTEDAEAWR